jgi:hypothetical protein
MRSSGSFSPLVNAKSLIVKSPATGVTPAIVFGVAGVALDGCPGGCAGADGGAEDFGSGGLGSA